MPGGTAPGETSLSARPGHCLSACIEQIAHKQPPQAQVRAPAEASSGLSSACSCGAQAPLALVLPRVPAPQLPLTDTLGRSICLPARLRGKVTAVQLMFAGCSSTCPIQGAVFAAVAQKVKAPDVRLLSLTVDPLDDTPQSLHTWLGRFGHPGFGRPACHACRMSMPVGIPARHSSKDGNTFVAGLSLRQTSKACVPDH